MTPKRQTIATFGPKRGGVRVVRERDTYLVMWRQDGARRYKSFPRTRSGRASALVWGKAFWEAKTAKQQTPITVRELWERYQAARFDRLRERTQVLYAQRFRWWMDFIGPETPAETVTLEQIERFRKEQKATGRAINQIRAYITVAKIVWNWGERAELLMRNRLGRYRFEVGKAERIHRPDAYTEEEFQAILATFDPRTIIDWRAWAVLTVLGRQGVRANSALHLRWEDVDFDEGWLVWRREWDKMGREWTQPMLSETREALCVALGFNRDQPWVFPTARPSRGSEVFTIQSLSAALWRAEKEAEVEHKGLRAAHGFRRMVVNRVRQATDDPALALRFVGDTDIRQAVSYVRVEREELEAVARLLEPELENRR